MKALALVIALAQGACFASWGITQAAGGQSILDEKMQKQRVPLPGVREELSVRLPLSEQVEVATGDPVPFAVSCEARQRARDEVHHTGFRYGSTWKKVAITALVIEAAIAASLYFSDNGSDVVAGVFAADALGTAVLALRPRKDVYRKDEWPMTSTLRSDCPDGLALEIDGQRHPIDAAGRIGDAAFAALDGWMKAPIGRVRIVFGDRSADVTLGNLEVCTWRRDRHRTNDPMCARTLVAGAAFATLVVPTGTLTQIAGP